VRVVCKAERFSGFIGAGGLISDYSAG